MKKLFFSLLLIPSISSAYSLIFNPFTGKLDYVGVDTTTIAGNFIQNRSTLQSGAIFNVSSGTIAGPLAIGDRITYGVGSTGGFNQYQTIYQDVGAVSARSGWDNTLTYFWGDSAALSSPKMTLSSSTGLLNPKFGVLTTTITAGSSTDTSLGSNPWVTINSSGTSEALVIQSYGKPSGGYQNKLGAVTIISSTTESASSGFAQPLLVLVDSTTDAQLGTGIFEIWSQNPNHNDPIFWMHTNSPNSGPDMRVDSKAFNFEFVNLSTDNAHGMGKWEIAMANQGIDFQFNNRAYNNSTFETMMYLHPLHTALAGGDGLIPGIYMNPQNTVDDGGILTSSGTSGITFFTLNAHTVGLTAPPNTTVSWTNALPDTIGATGNMLYHGGTVTNGQFTSRQWKWASDFNYSATTGVSVSSITVSGSSVIPNGTKAFIGARTPGKIGEQFLCTDCSNTWTCISTGTAAAGQYAAEQAANRTTACN